MLTPNQRVVMISGANRGIGLAIARHLNAKGYRLSLGLRNPGSLDLGSFDHATDERLLVSPYDATIGAASTTWVEHTLEQFGSVDALVLNAGVMKSVGLLNPDEADLDLMWDINFKAPLRLVSAALQPLKNCGHGRVVNIVSLSGKRVLSAGNIGYSASKFAALSLTHAIRQQGWADGIRATAICPGLVDTDMVADVVPAEGQFKIHPATIAASTAYALSLPNEAAVAELLINSRLESML